MVRLVVEGPDNSGKSTLVGELAKELKLDIVEGRGPPQSLEEINERACHYLTLDNCIFDRHPCVSNPIFDKFRSTPLPINADTLRDFYTYSDSTIFIYCRGRGLDGQVIKEHDQRENDGEAHHKLVSRAHADICAEYDAWALQHAQFIYHVGKTDMWLFATAIKNMLQPFDPVADVEDFHHKFNLFYDGPPRALPADLRNFRNKFLEEELKEWRIDSAWATRERDELETDPGNYLIALEKSLDALVDLCYVAIGTAHLSGFNFREAWRRVQAANMLKVRAERAEDSKRGSTFDVIKPPGWEAPSHVDLVERNDVTSKSG